MNVQTINRTIHPATHKSKNSYRVKIGKRNYFDQLVVHIHHENIGFIGTYVFDGKVIAPYESIHFKATELNGSVDINWVQSIPFTKCTNL